MTDLTLVRSLLADRLFDTIVDLSAMTLTIVDGFNTETVVPLSYDFGTLWVNEADLPEVYRCLR